MDLLVCRMRQSNLSGGQNTFTTRGEWEMTMEASEGARWKRDMIILGFAAVAMFCVDFILGTTSSDAFHQGPFGVTWIWTPGSTVVYLTFLLLVIRFIRQGPVEART